jgi:hypothetical protein
MYVISNSLSFKDFLLTGADNTVTVCPMRIRRLNPVRHKRELREAIDELRTAVKTRGWFLRQIEPRVFHICLETGTPFYTVRLQRRVSIQRTGKETERISRLYYDIGGVYVRTADTAITKIIERVPK